ncbi:MAG: GNAT family N-acetyltransferase [Planktomarina sp.]
MTDLFEVLEATWPAVSTQSHAGWTLRDGAGGGKRVSATTMDDPSARFTDVDDQPLFMVRDGQDELDTHLGASVYAVVDPTLLYACPIELLIQDPLPLAKTYAVWPPLHCMIETWATGGTGPERLAVMDRVKGPKTAILGRDKDVPVGAAFVAIHKDTAMLHSVEVLLDHRRQGVARRMMNQAAHWARRQGATRFSLAVVNRNDGANALYASMGMQCVGQYHYRKK